MMVPKADSWKHLYQLEKKERETKMAKTAERILQDKQDHLDSLKATQIVDKNLKNKTVVTTLSQPRKSPVKKDTRAKIPEIRSDYDKAPPHKVKINPNIDPETGKRVIRANNTIIVKPEEYKRPITGPRVNLQKSTGPENIKTVVIPPIVFDDSLLLETDLHKKLMRKVEKEKQKFKIPQNNSDVEEIGDKRPAYPGMMIKIPKKKKVE
jgi:hypothetical protein